MFVKLPETVCRDEELSDQLMRVSEELGSAMAEIGHALEDGVIDPMDFNGLL
ncbi:hypothetical protein [Arsukibacterium perlucidum]|uniref:hypothetical protein n=1 Tax=Arsukibacterium perlucidum TaxID=368811 RepID=UPI0003A10937|nr:hypothetical protein [Arsukibacterium perlucidum]